MRRKVPRVIKNHPKVSYYDMISERPQDLLKKYKTDTRSLEIAVREQCMDAPREEIQKFYENDVYSNKKRN